MGLANPLPGRIQANEEPWDGTSFRVTATFQDHLSGNRAAGIDFGNGRCGDPVVAMESGTVVLAAPLGLANVVRVRHPDGFTSGYAHLATIGVRSGQEVAREQQVGTVGMTGADACHLHGGYTDPSGVEKDFWPLLDQNQEDSMQLEGSNIAAKHNTRTTIVVQPVGNLMVHPRFSGGEQVGQFPFGTEAFPQWQVAAEDVRGNTKWYWASVHLPGQGIYFGYLSDTELSAFTVVENPPDPVAPTPAPPLDPDVAQAKLALVEADKALATAYSAGGVSRTNISKARLRIREANGALA